MTAEGVRRGGIYLVDLGADANGQPKKRPVLVVQNDQGNQAGATTVVVSLTSVVPSQLFPFQVHLPAGVLGKPGVIHCEQIKTVGIDRVEPHAVADCPPDVMRQVDEALRASLGL
jgi:mRNA-degrading endonuclease toxin of MazEF toxin-antitoxin module